ncbi:histidine kinase [Pedobacter yulinensis]|uniref:histidine kinase n=1 Tax=Pedobacter yulinensis TaxID=2126353 RepID=A0A2T3HGL6_9SPHI|nr:ATP-binding protein [Pedobacter yulinensis]PST81579.1 histidine kinase [Pedobacter yulinensis]
MSTFQADLTNCDREPIQIPGKIQSHGFAVAVAQKTLIITAVSDHIGSWLPVDPDTLPGSPLSVLENLLTKHDDNLSVTQLLQLGLQRQSFDAINPHAITLAGASFYLICSLNKGTILLEFEPASLEYDIQGSVGRSASAMLGGKNLQALLHSAATEIKRIIGYDRVMIYKFLEDGHGEVIAEEKEAHLDSFYGLHYPASDIPKQARALYKLNLTRLIADVHSQDAALLANTEEPLDLTFAQLRAVSPIHIQYLKNMGVASSFSISLIAHDQLWGLVACHNYSPKYIDYKAREGAKLLGQILSSALEYRQEEEDADKVAAFKSSAAMLAAYLAKDKNLVDALTSHERTLVNCTEAHGAALLFENTVTLVGQTPAETEVLALAAWLKQNMGDSVYHTHQLPEIYRPASAFKEKAAGILSCLISRELSEMMIWFKPERISLVQWAGNPEKPAEPGPEGLMQLSPRKSFESWTQEVRNTSERWTQEEITAVLSLREIVIADINNKATAIRTLNEKLQAAYEELDTFSYTISHDLRTPITSIRTYAEMLLKTNFGLNESSRKMINRIVAGTEKMNFLIREVLNLSKVGRAEIVMTDVEMGPLIGEIAQEIKTAMKAADETIEVGATPPLRGDRTMLSQVFSNIIGNGVKYSSKNPAPRVKINGVVAGGETVYSIADNGIGIDVSYYDRVFELFKRMDNVADIDGTGVGLAIVKRIVERHQGRVWFESKLGTGTTFFVAFRNR